MFTRRSDQDVFPRLWGKSRESGGDLICRWKEDTDSIARDMEFASSIERLLLNLKIHFLPSFHDMSVPAFLFLHSGTFRPVSLFPFVPVSLITRNESRVTSLSLSLAEIVSFARRLRVL